MADTSLVFNIIARDSGVGRALSAVQRAFRGAGQEAESSLGQAAQSTENLDRMLEEARGRVVTLSQEFERTGDKKLFGQISRDRSLVTQLEKVRSTLRDTGSDSNDLGNDADRLGGIWSRISGIFSSAGGSASGLGGSISGALPPIGQMVLMVAQLSAGLLVAPAAIYAVGAAAASLPGLLSGAIAALFTLKLGLSGLSENWAAMNKPASGGGGGGGGGAAKVDPTPKIRAVEAAQRNVAKSTRDIADAQKDLKEATDAVNRAREDELERIDDLSRSLRGAKIDEKEATQGLLEAQQDLANAQARGNPESIQKAQVALEKQQLALDEAKDKTGDLEKESSDAAKKGVEGSDAVVAAKKRETDAQRAVQDAVEQHKLALQQLGDAQKSLNEKIAGAGAAAAGGIGVQLPKIAKSAQEFLDKLKALKPAFDDLRLDIQQRLFQGLADKLQILADRWLPALHTGLGAMADTINGVVKTAFDSLSDPDFIKNTMVGVDAVRGALGTVGQAIAGPLVDAWGRLSAASAPFITMLGDKLGGIITQFANWIKKADESGKLTAFFEKATSIVGSLFDIFTNLARIAGSVISILFGTKGGSTDAWQNLADASDKVADWLGDPKTQQNISKMIDSSGSLISVFGNIAYYLDDIYRAGVVFVGWLQTAYTAVKTFFTELPDTISKFFTDLGTWFSELPGKIGAWLSTLPGVIGGWLSQAVSTMGYWIGYGIGWVIGQFIALPGNIARAVSGLGGRLKTLGYNAIIDLWNGANSLMRWLKANAKNIPANIVNGLASLSVDLWNAGYNAVIGLWNGISSLGGWIYQNVRAFASNLWQGMKDALGISSPSKVMADRVGKWIPLGIAAGIDNHAASVTDAAGRLASSLAGTRMELPGLDGGALEGQLTAATNSVVSVRANQQEHRVILDIRGGDGDMVKMIRKWDRQTGGLLVGKG